MAVLQTGTGNDWDTDSLLVGLLAAIPGMSITTNYVSGQITVSDETAENYVGVTETDASAAVAVLDAAGLDPTTGTGTITFDHTWLEATFGSTTVKLDPAWKFRDFQEGLGDMLDVQSFDANDYLSTVKTETAAEYYEQKVRDYLAANDPSKTIADVPYAGPIHPQVIDSLPTTLPFDGIAGTFTVNGSYPLGRNHANGFLGRLQQRLGGPCKGADRTSLGDERVCHHGLHFADAGNRPGGCHLFSPRLILGLHDRSDHLPASGANQRGRTLVGCR